MNTPERQVWFGFMVFNATFNNISVISWRSVLLVKETGGPEKTHDRMVVQQVGFKTTYQYHMQSVM
jgi:hypothetical protein